MTTLAASVSTTSPIVDPEFHALVPPLQGNERDLLEQSLQREGCRESLVVWAETGVLIDGHNRLDICTGLDIPFNTTQLSFRSREEALLWVIENQLGRRNLADIDRIALAAQREPLLKARAAANRGSRTDLLQNSSGGSVGIVREAAAAAAGVSHDTYTKGKVVLEKGVPELVQAVREDEVSIHAAFELAKVTSEEQVTAIASGKATETAKALRENRRQKNTGNNEWRTPPTLLNAVREVLGDIDVDPATHAGAQFLVKAKTFYTKNDDGLSKPWNGTVFLNPPYSKKLVSAFIEKLITEHDAGNVTAAVVLVNNETDSGWFQLAAQHAAAICLHRGRVKFLRGDGNASQNGPLQGQVVLFFGKDTTRFVEVFTKLGVVVARVAAVAEVGSDG